MKDKCFKVRVPATSANMGPGFDSLGIAFQLFNEYIFTEIESGVEFIGFHSEFANKDNIIFKAMEKCIMDNNREEKAKNFKKYVEDNYSLIRFYSEYKDIFEKIALKG